MDIFVILLTIVTQRDKLRREYVPSGYLQTGSTASAALEASLGFPRPALFMAMTLNSYSEPSVSCTALMVLSMTGRRLTFAQVSSVASRFSTM